MTKKAGAMTSVELCAMDTRAATFTGSAVDIKDADSNLAFTQYSTVASIGDTLNGKIQHSDDGSTGWTDVTGLAFATVDFTNAGFETVYSDSKDLKRYVRYVGTIAGSTVSVTFGAMLAYYGKNF